MYTVGNGAILEVSFRGRSLGQRTISLFHYRYETDADPVDGIALINTANPLINAAGAGKLLKEYMTPLVDGFTMEEVVYQWLFPTRRARIVKVPAVPTGAIPDAPLPPNVALTITKRSDVAGRHGVGSLHMPGTGIAGLNGGEWIPAYLDSFGSLLTALHQSVNIEFGQNLVPVIFNRTTPTDSVEITSANSNVTVRTMHRRTVGVGE